MPPPITDVPATPGRRISQLIGANGVLALFDDGSVGELVGTNDLPGSPVEQGVSVRAVAVAGSRTAACILWANGASQCGHEMSSWLAAPLAQELVSPSLLEEESFSCGILRDGHVACPHAGDHPWNNDVDVPAAWGPAVRLGQPAVAMTGGSLGHFCAALLNGEVKCWPTTDGITYGLGGTVATASTWPSVDLGTRTAH